MFKTLLFAVATTLTLTSCQSTREGGSPPKLATITPAQFDNIKLQIAAHAEGDPRAGSVFASEMLGAEISEPFWHPLLLNNEPHTSYCVTIATGFSALPKRVFYVFNVFDSSEGAPNKRKMHVESSDKYPISSCNGKAMSRFDAIFALREKRRAAHANAPAPEAVIR